MKIEEIAGFELPGKDGRCDYIGLSSRALQTYALLWQLEAWMRRMVYVEIKSFSRDFLAELKSCGVNAGERSLEAEAKMVHMKTPERENISYMDLSQIIKVIDEKWVLFSSYLPPKDIFLSKMQEVRQIRNRVAHFRKGHCDDHARVTQMVRDMDRSVWLLCSTYNNPEPCLPPDSDAITRKFLHLDPFPWTLASDGVWGRCGFADPNMRIAVSIEMMHRPWLARPESFSRNEGKIYDVNIHARGANHINYRDLIGYCEKIIEDIIHIVLDDFAKSLRITIPAVLGEEKIMDIIEKTIKFTEYSMRPGATQIGSSFINEQCDRWPEKILTPYDPLAFISSSMPCSIMDF